jgi:hypothetical protein
MSERAAIHSAPASPHVGRIEFSEPRLRRHDFTCRATVVLDGEEWSVGLDMIEPYRAEMMGFFDELAREASGWAGEKAWSSEFAELELGATHDGADAVTFRFRIRWPPRYEEERDGSLVVRAQALDRLAAELRSFLCIEPQRLRPI